MHVREESWILGFSARVALSYCDSLVLYLHACTDGSLNIARKLHASYPGRVVVATNDSEKWDEMAQRQEALRIARDHGATHAAIVDSDEVASAQLATAAREMAEKLAPGQIISQAAVNLRNGWNYHANGLWANRRFDWIFRDAPHLCWKGDKFHSRAPDNSRSVMPYPSNHTPILHLWGYEERRLIAKHSLYKLTERLRFPARPVKSIEHEYSLAIKGSHEIGWGNPATWTYAAVPDKWLAGYQCMIEDHLVQGEIPWQEAEVKRLLELHGRSKFDGLDLFGF